MKSKKSGQSALEFAFFLPFLIFLFCGAFDWGFYSSALVSTENAARSANIYTSSSSSLVTDLTGACTAVLAELAYMPNVPGLTNCTNSTVTVTTTSLTGPDGSPAAQVAVAYKTVPLIPI